MTHRLEDLIGILEEYIQFIQPYEVLLNTHNVQFINDQHWTSDAIIHPELRKDLDQFIEANKEASSPVPIINLVKYYSKFSETTAKKEPSNSPLDRLIAQLYAFHETWNRQVLTDLKDVDCLDQTAFSAEHDPEFKFKFKEMGRQNRFMNQKKIYEVDTMSIVVGKLCKRQGISTVRGGPGLIVCPLFIGRSFKRKKFFLTQDCRHWKREGLFERPVELAIVQLQRHSHRLVLEQCGELNETSQCDETEDTSLRH